MANSNGGRVEFDSVKMKEILGCLGAIQTTVDEVDAAVKRIKNNSGSIWSTGASEKYKENLGKLEGYIKSFGSTMGTRKTAAQAVINVMEKMDKDVKTQVNKLSDVNIF